MGDQRVAVDLFEGMTQLVYQQLETCLAVLPIVVQHETNTLIVQDRLNQLGLYWLAYFGG